MSSEPKFEVGDRVRIVGCIPGQAEFMGMAGDVVELDGVSHILYGVKLGMGALQWFWGDELAPAPEPGLPLSVAAEAGGGLSDALPPAAPLTAQAHYVTGGVEAIDFIEANGLGFCLGNAAKYIARAGKKGGPEDHVADLEKARNYITREINRLRGTPGWEAK